MIIVHDTLDILLGCIYADRSHNISRILVSNSFLPDLLMVMDKNHNDHKINYPEQENTKHYLYIIRDLSFHILAELIEREDPHPYMTPPMIEDLFHSIDSDHDWDRKNALRSFRQMIEKDFDHGMENSTILNKTLNKIKDRDDTVRKEALY